MMVKQLRLPGLLFKNSESLSSVLMDSNKLYYTAKREDVALKVPGLVEKWMRDENK